jgi:hypothetical protein
VYICVCRGACGSENTTMLHLTMHHDMCEINTIYPQKCPCHVHGFNAIPRCVKNQVHSMTWFPTTLFMAYSLGGSLPLIFCIHVQSGPIYGGLLTLHKILKGDGVLHVKSLKIFYVMIFYM